MSKRTRVEGGGPNQRGFTPQRASNPQSMIGFLIRSTRHGRARGAPNDYGGFWNELADSNLNFVVAKIIF